MYMNNHIHNMTYTHTHTHTLPRGEEASYIEKTPFLSLPFFYNSTSPHTHTSHRHTQNNTNHKQLFHETRYVWSNPPFWSYSESSKLQGKITMYTHIQTSYVCIYVHADVDINYNTECLTSFSSSSSSTFCGEVIDGVMIETVRLAAVGTDGDRYE